MRNKLFVIDNTYNCINHNNYYVTLFVTGSVVFRDKRDSLINWATDWTKRMTQIKFGIKKSRSFFLKPGLLKD